MTTSNENLLLDTRRGLPQDLLFLAKSYPKLGWDEQLHFNYLVQTWLGIHRMFRAQAHRIDAGVETVLNGEQDAAEMLPQFRSDVEQLLSHLDQHHRIEDHHYFPQFQQLEPRLAQGFEIMEADHHVIAEAIYTLSGQSRAFSAAVETPKPDLSETDRLAHALKQTITKFRANMRRHLDDEEDLVIPLVIDRHFS
jgi:iron-sulfur cluster repair protein YtfE (RIC family)